MKRPEPVLTAALFRPLHTELTELLSGLAPDDWLRPTLAKRWQVRDVVAHLLDGDLRRISFQRDGHKPPPPETAIRSYTDLVAFLNALNHEWIVAARRLSPAVLLALLGRSGFELADVVESLDPNAGALFGVAWAGERHSLNWMDIGREYTEKWHHQQQIREAVGAPLQLSSRWTTPLFQLSVRALPRAYGDVAATEGTSVALVIEGEGGGTWALLSEVTGWALYEGAPAAPDASIHLSTDVAWRLFYNALSSSRIEEVRVKGRSELALPLIGARSVMV